MGTTKAHGKIPCSGELSGPASWGWQVSPEPVQPQLPPQLAPPGTQVVPWEHTGGWAGQQSGVAGAAPAWSGSWVSPSTLGAGRALV